jgi:hypothetical protein
LRAQLALAGLVILLGGACIGGGGVREGTLELGTGEAEFVPLVDGQDVDLTAGAQGGHHLWLSMRSQGLASGRCELRVSVWAEDDPEGRQDSWVSVRVNPAPDGAPGTLEYIGWPGLIARPECFVERRVHFSVELTDERGARAMDERVVVPHSPDLGACAPR